MSNPYEAPDSDFDDVASDVDSDIMVDGKYIVVRTGAELPTRCFQCNAECGLNDKRITKTLYYHSKWIYLLILFNLLILLVVYLLVRKPVKISFSQCSRHAWRQFTETMFCLLSFGLAIGSVFAGLANEMPILLALAGLSFISFIVFAIRANRGLSPAKHKEGEFWIQGAGPEFLASLETE